MALLRKWEYPDILTISEIEKECFDDPWSYKMLADTFLFNKFTGLLIEEDGKVKGYCGYISVAGEADITRIAVAKKERRKGAGGALLKETLKTAKEAGVYIMTLEVRVSNEAAINLYKKNGFEITALRKNYYRDEDAYVMQYRL